MLKYSTRRIRAELVAHQYTDDFLDYLEANPAVLDWFISLVRACKDKGMTKVGAAYLRERFRWEAHLEINHDGTKFDNDWTPLLSRLIALEAPDLEPLFTFNTLDRRDT